MEDQNQGKTSKTATILLAVALLGSLGGNFFQYNRGQKTVTEYVTKVDTLEMARTEIETELNATYAELEKYKGQNAITDSLLAEATSKVDEQKTRINQIMKTVKNKEELNSKLSAELADLRKLKDNYLDKIDSLMVVNQQLVADKNDLNNKVADLDKNLKSTVTTASMLKVEYIKAIAYKKRGASKYSETAMAKRTNKIEVTFKVLENKIAKAGDKMIYLRIVEPGGTVIGNKSEGSKSVKINGEDVLFTNSTTLAYANANADVTLFWEEADRIFKPGNYTVEVYVEDHLAGASTVVLK